MRYVLIFPGLQEVHLSKDVGLIPRYLANNPENEVIIVTDREVTFQQKGIHFVRLKEGFIRFNLHLLHWIFRNRNNIQVLQVFHFSKYHFLFALILRIIGTDIVTYLKMDADNPTVSRWERRSNWFRKQLYRIGWAPFDIISIETEICYKRIVKLWPFIKDKFVLVPNGVDDKALDGLESFTNSGVNAYGEYFLYVGRVGVYQKATELLLDAFNDISGSVRHNLVLAGPVDDAFLCNWKIHANGRYANIAERVFFIGNVSLKRKLYQLYRCSQAFVLPSRWEGSSLALLEAASIGCYLVATDVGASREIIDLTNNGEVIPADDIASLKAALLRASVKDIDRSKRVHSVAVIREKYSYSRICSELELLFSRFISRRSNRG